MVCIIALDSMDRKRKTDGWLCQQQSPVTRALSSSLPFAVRHTYSFFFAYSRIRTRDRTKYTLIFLASLLYVYNLISISICIYQFIFCLQVILDHNQHTYIISLLVIIDHNQHEYIAIHDSSIAVSASRILLSATEPVFRSLPALYSSTHLVPIIHVVVSVVLSQLGTHHGAQVPIPKKVTPLVVVMAIFGLPI